MLIAPLPLEIGVFGVTHFGVGLVWDFGQSSKDLMLR